MEASRIVGIEIYLRSSMNVWRCNVTCNFCSIILDGFSFNPDQSRLYLSCGN